MHSAILPNGKLITANEYNPERHGIVLYCLDEKCRVPIHFVNGDHETAAYFKSSGKGNSVHIEGCGFAKKLSLEETLMKVQEYQESIGNQGLKEFVVRLNMNGIDPDYQPREVSRNNSEKEMKSPQELDEKLLKDKPETPSSLSSLKSIKKLLLNVGPDLLASIIISIKGNRIPISKIICSYDIVHKLFWNGQTLDVPYFVYGVVEKVIRREKVWYITLNSKDYFFTLVVFEPYFKHFTYRDDELVNRKILSTGYLRKNEYQKEKQSTEMVIKSNKYIELI